MSDLSVSVGGLVFPTPVLTAAGPNVRDHKIINRAIGDGVGGVVAKTFSTVGADYPKPAWTRTSNGGLINCETWSEKTPEECIADYRAVDRSTVPFVVSIGYSGDDMRALGPWVEAELAPDAIEFSTHYQDQSIEDLVSIAAALREAVKVPIWMKLSPNQPHLDTVIRDTEPIVDAYVAVNSLGPALDFNLSRPKPALGSPGGYGWLSGAPLLPIALQTVHRIAGITKKPIIGVGGVATGHDALKFIMLGASAVGVCSHAMLHGPSVYGRIAGEMDQWLVGNGYSSIEDLRGMYQRNS